MRTINRKSLYLFLITLCFLNFLPFDYVADATQVNTKGEIVLEKGGNSSTTSETSVPSSDRVDTEKLPVKKTGLLPAMGEIAKPLLLLLGGLVLVMFLVGIRLSAKKKEIWESEVDE